MRQPRFQLTTRSALRLIAAAALCAFGWTGHAAEVVNVAKVSYVDVRSSTITLDTNPARTVTGSNVPTTIRYFTNDSFVKVATITVLGDFLHVQANAPAANHDPAAIEKHNITISSKLTGDSDVYTATETGPNTGIFRIDGNVPTSGGAAQIGDGKIQTAQNDTLTAIFEDGGAKTTTTILVDPAGVVFDSKTNRPVSGARVTLVNADTGAPAIVFGTDGTTPVASSIITGADGRYSFPLVAPGTYRLEITPSPGYTAPSKLQPGDLPRGRNIHASGSYGGNFIVSAATGTVLIDVPLDSSSGTGLFIQKSTSRTKAEIGDFVDYTIRVKNVSGVRLSNVVIDDEMPHSVPFEKGSARLDDRRASNPRGGSGPNLRFEVGAIENDQVVTLTYRARVGVDAARGDGINRAQATNEGSPRARSNVARAKIEVQGGVFSNRGIIFGKVYVDKNRNRIQDAGELGIPGVRLYIEDGSYVITDSEGKYSFYGIQPRTHVVKLDRTTLPADAKLTPLNTRNAGNGGSVFAQLRAGEMLKVDFAESSATPEILAYVEKVRAAAERNESGEIASNLKADLNREGTQPLAADPRSLPATGTIIPGVAVQPTQQDRREGAESVVLGGSRQSQVSNLKSQIPASNATSFESVLPEGTLVEENAQLPGTASSLRNPELFGENPMNSPGALAASVPLDSTNVAPLTGATSSEPFGFIDLKDLDTLPIAQTNVRVKGVLGGNLALRVNGRDIPATRIGKRTTLAEQNTEALEFVGIALNPGENKLELTQTDNFGNARGSKAITVIAPDKLGQIKILVPDNAVADGKTPARVRVELVDAKGIPVTARTPLTLESSLGQWVARDLNPRESGVQVFIEGGRSEYLLASPLEPGDSRVRVSSGILRGDATVSFLPELRPLIGVGLIEGKINISNLSTNAIRATNSRDGFDEELREFATHGNDVRAAGRAAFFLKGKIQGNYLLTASYDSEKDTRDRLFRDIQPDEFYPIYGDSSVKGFEAQSTGKLYVRIDNKKSYLLYGDFVTQSASDQRQLGNYNRSLNGVREHFENSRVSANAWASYDNTKQVIEELRANGTSGPYFFRAANGIRNSEKVEILTRDRNNPGLILKTVPVTRFSDYEFEPFTGNVLFKAPVPSLDADLNPVSIRITYEVEQGGEKFFVYGADAQVKVTDRIEVGGAAVRDENPLDRYGLYSANAAFNVGMKTFLFGEFAHSQDDIAGSGNAGRVELRHNSDKLAARLFWGIADDRFKNQAAILSAGRTEGGAQISYRLAKNTRAFVQAVDTESREAGERRGVMAGIEQTFAGRVRLEIAGRYSTESRLPASISTATTRDATPNEVRSARAKLTVPVPWTDGAAHVYGEYEQDIFNADKRLAAVGGEYQLDTKTRVYARHELISSLGGPFELNKVQEQNNTVFGVESAYMKNAGLFNEYRARDAFGGREAETAVGLRNLWPLADGLRASTTFERVAPVEGVKNQTNESTAATAALEYTANPNWKGTARLELRTSSNVDSLLKSLGVAYKLSDNWTALGKTILYLAHNKGPSASDQGQGRAQLGLAWRQTDTNVWNALGKYEFKAEEGAPGQFGGFGSTTADGKTNRRVNILSLDANFQPDADWVMSAHYGGKLAYEDSNDRSDSSTAHLVAGRVTRDLTNRWDIGVNSSALVGGDGRSVQYGVGPEVGYTLGENLRVGVGYNFAGFYDQDLSEEQYTASGFYLAMRLKFDETLFHRRKKEGQK